jgi:hypothetical protein
MPLDGRSMTRDRDALSCGRSTATDGPHRWPPSRRHSPVPSPPRPWRLHQLYQMSIHLWPRSGWLELGWLGLGLQ